MNAVPCALYERVSSKKQGEGASLEEQDRDLRAHAAAHGWEIVGVYREEASSWHGVRAEFDRMVEDARRGLFKRILVWKLDRFARRSGQMYSIVEELESLGVYLVLVKEGMDLSAGGVGTMAIKAALSLAAEIENVARADRSRMMHDHRRQLRQFPGWLPTGYTRTPGKGKYQPAEIDEQEAAGVRRAYEVYAGGIISIVDLCSQLNSEGHRLKGGGRFQYRSLHHILTNRHYTGMLEVDGQWVKAVEPAIVSMELFERVQVVIGEHARAPRSVSRKFQPYLLKGLVYCDGCKRKMYAQRSGNGINYYKDSAYFAAATCPAGDTVPEKLIPETVLAVQIEKLVGAFRFFPSWRERVKDLLATREERRTIAMRRQAIHAKLERLKTLYSEGDMELAEYRGQRDALREELASLVVPKEEAVLDAGQFLESMAALWQKATVEHQHDMLRGVIRRVWVDRQTQRIVGIEVYPDFAPVFRQVSWLEEQGDRFRMTETVDEAKEAESTVIL